MGKKDTKQKVEMKSQVPVPLLCAMLRDFATGLEKGKIILEQDNNKVELSLPQIVEAKVSGQKKEGKEKFSMELAWRSGSNKVIKVTSA